MIKYLTKGGDIITLKFRNLLFVALKTKLRSTKSMI